MINKNLYIFILPVFFTGILAAFPFDCSSVRDAGVWQSLDRGENWEQKVVISKNQTIATANVSTMTFDPRDPKIIYLGTRGEGMYKSMDGGGIWYHLDDQNNLALDQRANVYDIAINPKDTNILYAGVYQNKLGRLLLSSDAGKNWQEVYRVSREQYAVFAVEIDSYDPSVVYLGTAEGGLLKSLDFGKSWKVVKWFDDVITDIKVNPYDPKANNGLAVCFARAGNFEAAMKFFRRAIKLNPFDPEPYRNLALLYKELNMPKESGRLMLKAQSLKPL